MIVKPESAIFNAGSYPVSEAARMLGAPNALVHRWLRLLNEDGRIPINQDRTITFAALIALHVVKLFRDDDVPLPMISRLWQTARGKFRAMCPFATKRFQVDGQKLISSLRGDTSKPLAVSEAARCELAFQERVAPFFAKVDFRGQREAARYWPMGREGRVVLDPERKFGKPIDHESGVPTKAIYSAFIAGGGQEPQTVAEWLDVSLDSVHAAVAFEQQFGS